VRIAIVLSEMVNLLGERKKDTTYRRLPMMQ